MYFVVHYDLVIRTDPRAIGRFKLFTISSYYSHDYFDQNTFGVFFSVITQIYIDKLFTHWEFCPKFF